MTLARFAFMAISVFLRTIQAAIYEGLAASPRRWTWAAYRG